MGLIRETLDRLLPSGKAFEFVVGGNGDAIHEAVATRIEDARDACHDAEDATDPERCDVADLVRHEEMFFLQPVSSLTNDERRARVVAAWKDWGNCSPADLQIALQAMGFPLYIHEWWTHISPPAVEDVEDYFPPAGNGILIRNGLTTIAPGELSQCGMDTAQCGLESASCLYHDSLWTFAEVVTLAQCAVPQPEDPTAVYYPHLLLLCGETLGTFVDIPAERRKELESYLLKRRPLRQWIGLLVNYV